MGKWTDKKKTSKDSMAEIIIDFIWESRKQKVEKFDIFTPGSLEPVDKVTMNSCMIFGSFKVGL